MNEERRFRFTGLPHLRKNATALVHDFKPELIKLALAHDLVPSLGGFGHGFPQARKLEAVVVSMHFVVTMDVKEISWHVAPNVGNSREVRLGGLASNGTPSPFWGRPKL